jgi:hypothetical protein
VDDGGREANGVPGGVAIGALGCHGDVGRVLGSDLIWL